MSILVLIKWSKLRQIALFDKLSDIIKNSWQAMSHLRVKKQNEAMVFLVDSFDNMKFLLEFVPYLFYNKKHNILR